MVDFIKAVTEALREQDKSTEDLFQNGVVSKIHFISTSKETQV